MITSSLVCAKIGRHLDDERLRRHRSHRAEQSLELGRPRRPLVDELGVRRGDVELDEIAEGLEPADHLDVLLGRLARGGHDEGRRDAADPRGAVRYASRPGFLKPLQFTRPGPFGRLGPGRGSGADGRAAAARVMLFAVTAPNPSPMARAQDPRVVVHRREDERVRQPHAAEGDASRGSAFVQIGSRSSGSARRPHWPSAIAVRSGRRASRPRYRAHDRRDRRRGPWGGSPRIHEAAAATGVGICRHAIASWTTSRTRGASGGDARPNVRSRGEAPRAPAPRVMGRSMSERPSSTPRASAPDPARAAAADRLAHPQHHGDPLRARARGRRGRVHDLLHRAARTASPPRRGSAARRIPEARADPRPRARSRRSPTSRRTCGRTSRRSAGWGIPVLRDLSAHGGRGHRADARARAGHRGWPQRGARWRRRSSARLAEIARASGRPRARARVLSDLAQAVHDDQRATRTCTTCSPSAAETTCSAGCRTRYPEVDLADVARAATGRDPASRRALPLPPRPPRGLRARTPRSRRCATDGFTCRRQAAVVVRPADRAALAVAAGAPGGGPSRAAR